MDKLRSAQTDETRTEEAKANASESVIEADDLIEEVSIDGMCGVY
ncbi:mycofactocin precursor MftA [Streptomyces solisilvae]